MQWWVVACTEAEVDGVRPWSGPELAGQQRLRADLRLRRRGRRGARRGLRPGVACRRVGGRRHGRWQLPRRCAPGAVESMLNRALRVWRRRPEGPADGVGPSGRRAGRTLARRPRRRRGHWRRTSDTGGGDAPSPRAHDGSLCRRVPGAH